MASPVKMEEFVTAYASLLRTIMRMVNLPETDLCYAPLEGHTLPQDIMQGLEKMKSPEVLYLLQHMPYIANQAYWPCHIAPSAVVNDYWHPAGGRTWLNQIAWCPIINFDDPEPAPWVSEHEVPLTGDGDINNPVVVVDTAGPELVARVYNTLVVDSKCRIHSRTDNCSSLCKGRSNTELPAVELMQEYERNLKQLDWVPAIREPEIIKVDDYSDEYVARLQQAYRDCYWPSSDFDATRLRAIIDEEGFIDDPAMVSTDEDEEEEVEDCNDEDGL